MESDHEPAPHPVHPDPVGHRHVAGTGRRYPPHRRAANAGKPPRRPLDRRGLCQPLRHAAADAAHGPYHAGLPRRRHHDRAAAAAAPGANTRTIGLGTWSYEPATGQYHARFRFDRYVNGIYSGFSVVERELLLSEDGNEAAGDVRSVNYDANGAEISEVCGIGVSWRS